MVKNCFILSAFGAFLLLPAVSPAQNASSNGSPGSSLGVRVVSGHVAPSQISSADAYAGSLLGLVEGVIQFCNQVNPQSASAYKQADHLFTGAENAQAIDQVRKNDAYEGAFSRAEKQLKALPSPEALAVCNAH